MNKSEDISKIAISLSKLQGILGSVPKKNRVNAGAIKYTYADLADIWEVIRKPLVDNELAITQVFLYQEAKCFLETFLIHSSGQWLKSCLEVSSHERIQQLGSEITYLRRYGLSSILGIVTDEDDDGCKANDAPRSLSAPFSAPPQQVQFFSPEQVRRLEDELLGDEGYTKRILNGYKVNSLDKLPSKDFESIMKKVRDYRNQL